VEWKTTWMTNLLRWLLILDVLLPNYISSLPTELTHDRKLTSTIRSSHTLQFIDLLHNMTTDFQLW